MNWDQVEGKWKQVKGQVKERWGKLTDDELDIINGRREQLEGKLQTAYGRTKEQVRKEVDEFLDACDCDDTAIASAVDDRRANDAGNPPKPGPRR